MIKTTIKPIAEGVQIIGSVKKVRVFGVLVYAKVVYYPSVGITNWNYFPNA